jgi:hypothetical protein
VRRSQFQAWVRTLGVPIAAYDNRAWRERIPDVATQLIFGGSLAGRSCGHPSEQSRWLAPRAFDAAQQTGGGGTAASLVWPMAVYQLRPPSIS